MPVPLSALGEQDPSHPDSWHRSLVAPRVRAPTPGRVQQYFALPWLLKKVFKKKQHGGLFFPLMG